MEAVRRDRYRIGGLLIEVESPVDLLPQWAPVSDPGPAQLHLRVRHGLLTPPGPQAERIDTSVGPVWREGNRFTTRQFSLQASADLAHFEALLFGPHPAHLITMVYVLGARQRLLIHSACVVYQGQGYAFLAPSGTGKSTHADNWVRAFPGCRLLNDDNPVLSLPPHGPVLLHGSPWSGKRPIHLQEQAPLRALVRIVRDTEDRLVPLTPTQSLAMLLEAVSTLRRDPAVYLPTLETIKQVVARTPCYALHCLPHEEAARVCLFGIG